jgi:hypothetical protein
VARTARSSPSVMRTTPCRSAEQHGWNAERTTSPVGRPSRLPFALTHSRPAELALATRAAGAARVAIIDCIIKHLDAQRWVVHYIAR